MLTGFDGVGVKVLEVDVLKYLLVDGGIDENVSHKGDIFAREV